MCEAHARAAASDAVAQAPIEEDVTYTVTGMTCECCATSVATEVRQVPGVIDLDVDVTTGRLVIRGDAAADDVRAAVDRAGYAAARV